MRAATSAWVLGLAGGGAGVLGAEEPTTLERIDASRAERVAAEQAPEGDHRAPEQAEFGDRLLRVGRAGRVVAATGAEQGREPAAVGAQRDQADPGGERGRRGLLRRRFTCNGVGMAGTAVVLRFTCNGCVKSPR